MNMRTWARVLVAVLCFFSGLVETLSATGLIVELSPDARWGLGTHALSVSGPLQLAGAALIASGRKPRWALSILGVYVVLVGVLGNLPLVFKPHVGGSAIAGLFINLAVMGGILYWFHAERMPSIPRAVSALPSVEPAPVLPVPLRLREDSSDPPIHAAGNEIAHIAALRCR